ncbi:hypothetical protein Sden_3741 [Shewanella denitrificans OS217]|jgi:predicted GNAT family N-acyltransferase|uniref:N-acetyltransferase domain-containing protein n=1 Tax=Shewanella denitrificans (strain OS217 / ATCC BAA-1090 / DSM 15013) TaxID=318161 RepID=Q12HR2_SHEDO|nr:hypothetical protein [Shewanella denitrificans]ABE57014.1 hypothetical protein Sden_3741 [Shewanella denitrificans OS217]
MEIQLLEYERSYQKLLAHRQDVYEYALLEHLTNKSAHFDVELTQDKASLLFCGIIDDEIIASCRITELAYLDFDFQQRVMSLCPELDIDKTFMISRLCISAAHQGRQRYKQLLVHVCRWAKINHHNEYYLAKCRVALAPLYRAFGCVVIEGSRYYDELGGADYLLLLGSIQQTYDTFTKEKY